MYNSLQSYVAVLLSRYRGCENVDLFEKGCVRHAEKIRFLSVFMVACGDEDVGHRLPTSVEV